MKRNAIVLLSLVTLFFLWGKAQQDNDSMEYETKAEAEESIQEPVDQDQPASLPANTQMPDMSEEQQPMTSPQPVADESVVAPLTIEPAREDEEEQEVDQALVEKPVDYGEGVDTLNISGSGNWLLKRVWWEKGQSKFESIKAVLEKIFDARMDFFFKRSSIDKELNSFYLEIGFAQGELDEILQNMVEMIEKQPEEAINDDEREMLARLQKNKKELEQLKQDIASVAEIDNAIDTALTQMIDQINKCRKYEHEAWLRFKAIAQEIDDEKARELYYHMETLQENMQDVYAYLRGEFVQYFDDLLEKARDHIASVKTTVAALKEQGVSLEKKVEAAVTEQPIEEGQQVEEPVVTKPKKGVAKIVYGITNFLKNIVKTIIKGVKQIFKGIMAAVHGTKAKKAPAVEVDITDQEIMPAESTTPPSETVSVSEEVVEPMPIAPIPQEESPLAEPEPEAATASA